MTVLLSRNWQLNRYSQEFFFFEVRKAYLPIHQPCHFLILLHWQNRPKLGRRLLIFSLISFWQWILNPSRIGSVKFFFPGVFSGTMDIFYVCSCWLFALPKETPMMLLTDSKNFVNIPTVPCNDFLSN